MLYQYLKNPSFSGPEKGLTEPTPLCSYYHMNLIMVYLVLFGLNHFHLQCQYPLQKKKHVQGMKLFHCIPLELLKHM